MTRHVTLTGIQFSFSKQKMGITKGNNFDMASRGAGTTTKRDYFLSARQAVSSKWLPSSATGLCSKICIHCCPTVQDRRSRMPGASQNAQTMSFCMPIVIWSYKYQQQNVGSSYS
jgi:hypothetical protein